MIRGREDSTMSHLKMSPWATPRIIPNRKDCDFYHTMDIPGIGVINGQWDLRSGIRRYLGNVDFKRKRVLDIGSASGFVSFYIEKQGAEVVAYDLSDKQEWDVVPYADTNWQEKINKLFLVRSQSIQIAGKNGLWHCVRYTG